VPVTVLQFVFELVHHARHRVRRQITRIGVAYKTEGYTDKAIYFVKVHKNLEGKKEATKSFFDYSKS